MHRETRRGWPRCGAIPQLCMAEPCGMRGSKQEICNRRCTLMGRSPAGSFTADTLQPNLISRADTEGTVRSACICVHLRLQISCLLSYMPHAAAWVPKPNLQASSPGTTPRARSFKRCQNPMHQFAPAPQPAIGIQQPGAPRARRRRWTADTRQDPMHQFNFSLDDAQSPSAGSETFTRRSSGGRCGTASDGTARVRNRAAGAASVWQCKTPSTNSRSHVLMHSLPRQETRRAWDRATAIDADRGVAPSGSSGGQHPCTVRLAVHLWRYAPPWQVTATRKNKKGTHHADHHPRRRRLSGP